MPPTSTYTMRRNVKTKIERQHGECRCYRCGSSIKVGQAVFAISRIHKRSKASYRVYHEACYAETLH
jgi:hypothetical protein